MDEYRIDGLTKSFEIDGQRHAVLKGLRLQAPAHKITVILGKSGCGKTTLLRLISGLEKPDEGGMSFPENTSVAMVFQEARLMPWLSCLQNFSFGLTHAAKSGQRIARLMRTVGLAGFEDAFPHQMSGGMQQRAALARALACEPSLILMDEPFASLDYFTRATMQQELLRIHHQKSMGVIFVTHNLDEAVLLGDTIALMQDGAISAQWQNAAADSIRDPLSAPLIALKREILAEMQKSIKI